MEEEVQAFVAKIQMVTSIIQIVLSTVVCLILGPWSDLNGRKPVFLAIFWGKAEAF